MSRNRKPSLNKKINPTYYIFYEGETEEAYASLLRQKYKLQIKIKTNITGLQISNEIITRHLKDKSLLKKDKNFLMYDLDIEGLLDKLKLIKNSVIIASNPCLELWFLLHYQAHNSYINSDKCIGKLKMINTQYEKGKINSNLMKVLETKTTDAVNRAKLLTEYLNPSSTIYILVEELEKANKEKKI